MVIRMLRRGDLPAIDAIYRKHHQEDFSLPSLSNSVTFAVVEDDEGNMVGFGVVKMWAEAIMTLDLDKPKAARVEAMSLLHREAVRACHENGIEQMHVEVRDDNLIEILKKHYDYQEVEGTVLVRKL